MEIQMDADPIEESEQDESLLDLGDVVVDCPICTQEVGITEYHSHLLEDHPVAYVTMLATYAPTWTPTMLWDTVHQFYHGALPHDDDGDEYDNTYEQLLELCDHIGYHRVGVEQHDMDHVAPIVPLNAASSSADANCPICLEAFLEVRGPLRCLTVCKHAFCSTCIGRWLKEHKTCPICKKDVTDQMASISISSEADVAEVEAPAAEVRRDEDAVAASSSMNTT